MKSALTIKREFTKKMQAMIQRVLIRCIIMRFKVFCIIIPF